MIQSREPDIRRVAAWILVVQVAVTLAAAALCLAAWGSRHGGSALAGGSIGVIANLYMTLATLRRGGGAVLVLSRFLIGQFVKVGLTVAMFIIVARTGRAVWPPLIATYVATLVVFWAVPAIAAPRLPPRSRG
ncbi:MAG TPA: ATP synthase subunit I [Steroidobacteraceae bacterium]|nr:ATP synthase subunit I [Steroidobacteraceae bacterium]HNS28086.1 ATP synthase subunit I [Steroidobacteraceae bacterium]